MTNVPPVPEAQRAPWPAQPAPIEHPPEPVAAAPAASAKPAMSTGAKIGVGAAIGSAAIAAALLYVNHGRSGPRSKSGRSTT